MFLKPECQNVPLVMLVRFRHIVVFATFSLLLITGTAYSQNLGNPPPPPSAPSVAPTTFTVSWQHSGDPDTISSQLQERVPGGQWTSIGTIRSGQSSVTVTRTPGTYEYRTTEWRSFYWNRYEPDVAQISSTAITVQVSDGPVPEPDTVSTQMGYTYEVRQGDINFDGRQDLFIDRTGGGTSGNGTLEKIILQRLADGTFTTIIPSAAQSSTASNWPVAAVELLLRDFDLDGFVDIVVDQIAGAVGQIILSPGQILNNAPKGIVPMDAKFEQFMTDAGEWVLNHNYFEENVPYTPVTYYQWVPYCYWGWDGYYYCTWYLVYWTVNEPNYSVFDQDALGLRDLFPVDANGVPIPRIDLGSVFGAQIEALLRRVFGTTIFDGILSNGCVGVFAYDDDHDLPCNNSDLFGQILLANLVGSTDDGDWRYLTFGEKAEALAQGLAIRNVDKVRVYNRGFRIFGRFDAEVMAPNGHIYIGTETNRWSEDYSLEPTSGPADTFVHELTHVYQNRTEGCSLVCMGWKKLFARNYQDYIYYPISGGYRDQNFEQQAEMVQDRFRMRNGLDAKKTENKPVTLPVLESTIPF
jgi:hypothetical protein